MKKITVLIPAYNEELTIAKVVKDFSRELPDARIIVYDNNSDDKTSANAKKAGAEVVFFEKQGKGNVIQDMFEKIESDIYIMVDGDDTYNAKDIKKLLLPVLNNEADIVIGNRLGNFTKEEKKILHSFGNKLIKTLLKFFFPTKVNDLLSGYRVMKRDFVKGVNLISGGFAIETEMTIKALEAGYRIKEIPTSYKERPEGSVSKLKSFHDGYFIMTTMVELFRDYRPMHFFMLLSCFFFALTAGFSATLIHEWTNTGAITNIPNVIAAFFSLFITFQLFIIGFLASSVRKHDQNIMHMLKKIKERL